MFDPTVFDNLKVVIEGEVYDRDLAGELVVIDRNDLVNLAKFSREYQLTVKRHKKDTLSGTIILTAGLKEFNDELWEQKETGCYVQVCFTINHQVDPNQFLHQLQSIWGNVHREYVLYERYEDLTRPPNELTFRILFKRLVYEEQVDDLLEMVHYLTITLDSLADFLK